MKLKLAQVNIDKSEGNYLMNMSNARQYPVDLQRQVINDSHQTENKGAIVSEIAYLQQKIAQLSQQLQAMAS